MKRPEWIPAALAAIAVALALLLMAGMVSLAGCSPSSRTIVRTRDGNPIDVRSVPLEHQGETIAAVESSVRGRLPGVPFYVVPAPAMLYGRPVISYRVHGPRALIVLSWRIDPKRGFVVEDVPWEVDHLIAGTDDGGRPYSMGGN